MSDIYYAIKCGNKFVGYNLKCKSYALTYNLGQACTWREKSLAENCMLHKVTIPKMTTKDKETGLRIVTIEVHD